MNLHEILTRIRRRKLATATSALALVFALGVIGIASGTAQSEKDEREFKNTIPDHVPIKVKLKNEQSFKKMENKDWAREFEVEIKNTGTKPIYYLSVGLHMPEVMIGGVPTCLHMRYGRTDLIDFTAPILPEDAPILPGESVTLGFSAGQVKGYEEFRETDNLPNPKKTEFHLILLNFGDGTSLTGYAGAPMPDPKRRRTHPR